MRTPLRLPAAISTLAVILSAATALTLSTTATTAAAAAEAYTLRQAGQHLVLDINDFGDGTTNRVHWDREGGQSYLSTGWTPPAAPDRYHYASAEAQGARLTITATAPPVLWEIWRVVYEQDGRHVRLTATVRTPAGQPDAVLEAEGATIDRVLLEMPGARPLLDAGLAALGAEPRYHVRAPTRSASHSSTQAIIPSDKGTSIGMGAGYEHHANRRSRLTARTGENQAGESLSVTQKETAKKSKLIRPPSGALLAIVPRRHCFPGRRGCSCTWSPHPARG